MEFFRWLRADTEICHKLAHEICCILNKCIDMEILPDELELAQVSLVTLYTKKETLKTHVTTAHLTSTEALQHLREDNTKTISAKRRRTSLEDAIRLQSRT